MTFTLYGAGIVRLLSRISWLATTRTGGHVGGVLVVNTIEVFVEEFT